MKVLCIGCEEVRQVLGNGLGLGLFHVRSSILIGKGLDQLTKKPGRCKKKLEQFDEGGRRDLRLFGVGVEEIVGDLCEALSSVPCHDSTSSA